MWDQRVTKGIPSCGRVAMSVMIKKSMTGMQDGFSVESNMEYLSTSALGLK